MTEIETCMYILVNSDLGMKPGKIASQVGHVVQKLTERSMKIIYESDSISDFQVMYMKWNRSGHKKIVLKGTQKQLEKFLASPDTEYIIDEGRTQIPENSLTVVGFLPSSSKSDSDRFIHFKLMN